MSHLKTFTENGKFEVSMFHIKEGNPENLDRWIAITEVTSSGHGIWLRCLTPPVIPQD
jgi:hypothetical protein